jgi:gamma-glutamylcyclotransferase (GGCT)/AIG2-like uncharacterized protein YtfP
MVGHMPFRLFVYGTLKQGQRNFSRYCQGVLAIEPACVSGRLYHLSQGYHLPYGYPMLEVPSQHVLARGTRDYLADAALLERLARDTPLCVPEAAGDWASIAGEIQTFDDPLERFPALDELEDFDPGGKSLYHRVVVRVQPPQNVLVWTYVAADGNVPSSAVRIGSSWP